MYTPDHHGWNTAAPGALMYRFWFPEELPRYEVTPSSYGLRLEDHDLFVGQRKPVFLRLQAASGHLAKLLLAPK